jgi:hypothetical protein
VGTTGLEKINWSRIRGKRVITATDPQAQKNQDTSFKRAFVCSFMVWMGLHDMWQGKPDVSQ